jgi:hypothetical protein
MVTRLQPSREIDWADREQLKSRIRAYTIMEQTLSGLACRGGLEIKTL